MEESHTSGIKQWIWITEYFDDVVGSSFNISPTKTVIKTPKKLKKTKGQGRLYSFCYQTVKQPCVNTSPMCKEHSLFLLCCLYTLIFYYHIHVAIKYIMNVSQLLHSNCLWCHATLYEYQLNTTHEGF